MASTYHDLDTTKMRFGDWSPVYTTTNIFGKDTISDLYWHLTGGSLNCSVPAEVENGVFFESGTNGADFWNVVRCF